MAVRETPAFVGNPKGKTTQAAASTAQTIDIFTANATDGSAVTAISMREASTGVGTIKFLLHDGTNARYIGKKATAGVADTVHQILTSTNIPIIDDANPVLPIPAGWKLQAEIPSVANALDFVVLGGDYTA